MFLGGNGRLNVNNGGCCLKFANGWAVSFAAGEVIEATAFKTGREDVPIHVVTTDELADLISETQKRID